MSKLASTAKKYWFDSKSNIFKNYVDAICGMVVLTILPGLSLFSALRVPVTTWSNYVFPIVSICLAGAYDTYGRYEPHSPKNIKLGIRVVIDMLAIFLAAFFVGQTNYICRAAAPALLTLTGLSLVVEVWWRVKTAIELSPWYSR